MPVIVSKSKLNKLVNIYSHVSTIILTKFFFGKNISSVFKTYFFIKRSYGKFNKYFDLKLFSYIVFRNFSNKFEITKITRKLKN